MIYGIMECVLILCTCYVVPKFDYLYHPFMFLVHEVDVLYPWNQLQTFVNMSVA
jgi:hypothetical protein